MLQPTRDWVLVKPDEYLEHASSVIKVAPRDGVIVTSQEQFGRVGVVLAVGPGRKDKYGTLHPTTVKPGDRVAWGEFKHQEWHEEGKCFLIMEADVCGVLETEDAAQEVSQ